MWQGRSFFFALGRLIQKFQKQEGIHPKSEAIQNKLLNALNYNIIKSETPFNSVYFNEGCLIYNILAL